MYKRQEESWADYAAALEAAQALIGSNDEQAVNDAIAALEAAKNALEQKPEHVVDKTVLTEAIENAPSEEEAGLYTAKSWALYADVLTNAIDVRDSELATQLDVDNAVTALTQAPAELVTCLLYTSSCV